MYINVRNTHIFLSLKKKEEKKKKEKKGDNIAPRINNAVLHNSSYLAASALVRVHPRDLLTAGLASLISFASRNFRWDSPGATTSILALKTLALCRAFPLGGSSTYGLPRPFLLSCFSLGSDAPLNVLSLFSLSHQHTPRHITYIKVSTPRVFGHNVQALNKLAKLYSRPWAFLWVFFARLCCSTNSSCVEHVLAEKAERTSWSFKLLPRSWTILSGSLDCRTIDLSLWFSLSDKNGNFKVTFSLSFFRCLPFSNPSHLWRASSIAYSGKLLSASSIFISSKLLWHAFGDEDSSLALRNCYVATAILMPFGICESKLRLTPLSDGFHYTIHKNWTWKWNKE